PGDVAKMQAADIIFYNGLHLEGKMGDVFKSMSRKKVTVPIGERLDHASVLEDDKLGHDPHIWFNVELWRQAAGVVRDELAKLDAKNADAYKAAAASYQARLAKLHDWVQAEIASIPTDQRVLITSHDAFRYFGKAYGIEVKA